MRIQTILNEIDLHPWILELLTHLWYSCSQPEFVHLRQKVLREQVIKFVDAHENGLEELRKACYICLQHENEGVVERGIACLFVIGSIKDINLIEPLLEHPEESVRKAARTCIFEIRHRID